MKFAVGTNADDRGCQTLNIVDDFKHECAWRRLLGRRKSVVDIVSKLPVRALRRVGVVAAAHRFENAYVESFIARYATDA